MGVIGPDPDGAGSLKHVATRTTYDSSTGLLTRVEQGTTTGYTDTNWTAFSALEKTETVYDAHYRPIKQIAYSGASATVLGLAQTSYDGSGRPECSALRMNPSLFGTPPSSACASQFTVLYGSGSPS